MALDVNRRIAVAQAVHHLLRRHFVFGLIPLGVAIYAATLWALKIDGRDEFAALLAKMRAKIS